MFDIQILLLLFLVLNQACIVILAAVEEFGQLFAQGFVGGIVGKYVEDFGHLFVVVAARFEVGAVAELLFV